MSRVTLAIDGESYEVSGRTADLLEKMHHDFIEELKNLNDTTPRSGALDGPLQRLTAMAQKGYRQRVRDLVVDGIEPDLSNEAAE